MAAEAYLKAERKMFSICISRTYKSIYKLIMLPEEKYHNSETDRLLIPVIGFS
jgi:hypothetical protein